MPVIMNGVYYTASKYAFHRAGVYDREDYYPLRRKLRADGGVVFMHGGIEYRMIRAKRKH
jgi:hypothetical protein